MDWNNFTPSEFLEFCKDFFIEEIIPGFRRFVDGIDNIGGFIDKSVMEIGRKKK